VAAECGRVDVIGILLWEDVEAEEQSHFGGTVLHMAAQKGRPKVVAILLRKGFEVDRISKSGETALQKAAQFGHAGSGTGRGFAQG